ncbi:MAG: DUF3078 domain-containing protein [Bacteroidaceae bacterium]|nr:DUF3078 domain-containing protein [Bacteroidaceae bacterium]
MKNIVYAILLLCSLLCSTSVKAQEVVVDSIAVDTVDQAIFLSRIDDVIDNGLPGYATSVLFMPLVFDKQENVPFETLQCDSNVILSSQRVVREKEYNMWLVNANRQARRLRAARNYVMVNRPDLVKYNTKNLPKAPKEYIIVNDPTKQTVTIVEKPIVATTTDIPTEPVKVKRWITSFSSNIQISQVYVSDNWYQGGATSLNLLSDQLFTYNYNDPSGKLLFENLVQWKFNLITSAEDTVHKVRVSEDLFQINSKFGYKAFGKFYYSASMLFKTQLLTNYEPNSNVKQAEFFSPGELNVGLGMSYSHSYTKPVKLSHTLTLSPLSYNLRFVALPDIDPTKFGIDKGRTRNEVGSSLDYMLTWNFRYNIQWMSHVYAFTNYKTALVEWTNAFDFSFSNYFSARVYLDLRFDNSVAKDPQLGYLQIKELLSIGFSYKI